MIIKRRVKSGKGTAKDEAYSELWYGYDAAGPQHQWDSGQRHGGHQKAAGEPCHRPGHGKGYGQPFQRQAEGSGESRCYRPHQWGQGDGERPGDPRKPYVRGAKAPSAGICRGPWAGGGSDHRQWRFLHPPGMCD